jgi:hypothetical protein
VGVYYLLAALKVGKIGSPTDIRGGFIALLGYILIVAGLIKTGVAFGRRSRSH